MALISYVGRKKTKRRDSEARLKHDAEVDDILAAFKKIDESNTRIPTFVAVKLDRLPRYEPEELNFFLYY